MVSENQAKWATLKLDVTRNLDLTVDYRKRIYIRSYWTYGEELYPTHLYHFYLYNPDLSP
jgi:hypothetical protein